MDQTDLQVSKTTLPHLDQVSFDLIVCGSVSCVESFRLVRDLRKQGADVSCYLTRGARQFINPALMEWAAARPVYDHHFLGSVSHLACKDALIIAPATAHFLSQAAHGAANTPALALFQSYLGQRKPIFFVPAMNDSLMNPLIQNAKNVLSAFSHVFFVPSLKENNKLKFPPAEQIRATIAHHLHATHQRIAISFGRAKTYLDPIRYVSNYSSGRMGSALVDYFFQQGFQIDAFQGDTELSPAFVPCQRFETNHELKEKLHASLDQNKLMGTVHLASLLDFIHEEPATDKIKSSSTSALEFRLSKTEKILATVPSLQFKIAFKLETDKSVDPAYFEDYMIQNQLSMLIVNFREDIQPDRYRAFSLAVEKEQSSKKKGAPVHQEHLDRESLIQAMANHLKERLA